MVSPVGAGAHRSGPFSTAFAGQEQGAERRVVQLGYELVPKWDLGGCEDGV